MPTTLQKVDIDDISYFDSLVDDRIIKDRVQAISVTVDKAKAYDKLNDRAVNNDVEITED